MKLYIGAEVKSIYHLFQNQNHIISQPKFSVRYRPLPLSLWHNKGKVDELVGYSRKYLHWNRDYLTDVGKPNEIAEVP